MRHQMDDIFGVDGTKLKHEATISDDLMFSGDFGVDFMGSDTYNASALDNLPRDKPPQNPRAPKKKPNDPKKRYEYFAAASRKARKKRRDEQTFYSSRNFLLEQERPVLLSKVQSLTEELELLQEGGGTTSIVPRNQKYLLDRNNALKQELSRYKMMSGQIKNFLNNFNKIEVMSSILSAFDKNLYFLMNNLLSMALQTSKKKCFNLRLPSNSNYMGNKVFEACLKTSFGSRINELPEYKRIGNHWFSLSSCKWEARYEVNKQDNTKWCRIDLHDIPVPRKDFVKLWKMLDDYKWFKKIQQELMHEDVLPHKFLNVEISQVMDSQSETHCACTSRNNNVVQKQSSRCSPTIVKHKSLQDDETKNAEIFFVSASEPNFVHQMYFPDSQQTSSGEAELFVHSNLPAADTTLEDFHEKGTTMFRGAIVRAGTTNNSSDLTLFCRLKEKSIDYSEILKKGKDFAGNDLITEAAQSSRVKKFDIREMFEQQCGHPKVMASKLETLIQFCVFQHNNQQLTCALCQ